MSTFEVPGFNFSRGRVEKSTRSQTLHEAQNIVPHVRFRDLQNTLQRSTKRCPSCSLNCNNIWKRISVCDFKAGRRKWTYVSTGFLGHVNLWGAWDQIIQGTCGEIENLRNPQWDKIHSTSLYNLEVLVFPTRPLGKSISGTSKVDIPEKSIRT